MAENSVRSLIDAFKNRTPEERYAYKIKQLREGRNPSGSLIDAVKIKLLKEPLAEESKVFDLCDAFEKSAKDSGRRSGGRDFKPLAEEPYVDVLLPAKARARIETAVINLLKTPGPMDLTETAIGVWKAMKKCYEFLMGRSDDFSDDISARDEKAFQDLVAVVRCSRYSLGYTTCSDGRVAGRLSVQWKTDGEFEVVGSSCLLENGILNHLDKVAMKTDAQYIIVVQKQSLFKNLVRHCFWKQTPSILITAGESGSIPDIVTRFFLHRLSRTFPKIPILGLFDWSPTGLQMLSVYKYGNTGIGLEAFRLGCSNMKWLGLRNDEVSQYEDELLQKLTQRDRSVAEQLKCLGFLPEEYKEELDIMVKTGSKAEFDDSENGNENLTTYLATRISEQAAGKRPHDDDPTTTASRKKSRADHT